MFGTGDLVRLALMLLAPPGVEGLSPIERQAPDFYNAVGAAVTVRWRADPAAVELGGDIELTLLVEGATNPTELARPRPDFDATRFQLADGETVGAVAGSGRVEFRYRLRPKAAGSFEWPALRYAYYRPRRPEGSRFPVAYADPLVFTVTAPRLRADAPPASLPVAPEEFFTLAELSAPRLPLSVAFLPVLLFLPGAWAIRRAARHYFPNAGDRLALRRRRDARQALRQLTRARDEPDPARATSVALRAYLRARYSLTSGAVTVQETLAELGHLEVSSAVTHDVAELLARCDAARFARSLPADATLPDDARARLLVWEAEGR